MTRLHILITVMCRCNNVISIKLRRNLKELPNNIEKKQLTSIYLTMPSIRVVENRFFVLTSVDSGMLATSLIHAKTLLSHSSLSIFSVLSTRYTITTASKGQDIETIYRVYIIERMYQNSYFKGEGNGNIMYRVMSQNANILLGDVIFQKAISFFVRQYASFLNVYMI